MREQSRRDPVHSDSGWFEDARRRCRSFAFALCQCSTERLIIAIIVVKQWYLRVSESVRDSCRCDASEQCVRRPNGVAPASMDESDCALCPTTVRNTAMMAPNHPGRHGSVHARDGPRVVRRYNTPCARSRLRNLAQYIERAMGPLRSGSYGISVTLMAAFEQ